jgi:phospholipid/cholesterol/gamma-HCH transport system ATP-binding protein
MLEINDLSFSRGSREIFNNLDLSIEAGESVVIFGASGSGKSTLLDLVMGGGGKTASGSISFSRDDSAMVLQDGALLDHLTVEQNLALVSRFSRGTSRGDIPALLEGLNIDASLHKRLVSTLSGGQRRRVAIARALVRNPSLVLFDEPDAGLDLRNLVGLAKSVTGLVEGGSRAVLTMSHNPIYAARVATHVYQLINGKLEFLKAWDRPAIDDNEAKSRQDFLEGALLEDEGGIPGGGLQDGRKKFRWAFPHWVKGVPRSLFSVLKLTPSPRDYISVVTRVYTSAAINGLLFYALVGGMLGATTIAVIKTLTDRALSGIVGLLLKPETLLGMMGGTYVVFLAPAIGGILFVARSGSITSSWLGELVRGKQVKALDSLGVSADQYLRGPVTVSLVLAFVTVVLTFAAGVWAGSVLATRYLFELPNAAELMRITPYAVQISDFWLKIWLYAISTSLTITGLGMASKTTSGEVMQHTTKVIIYATVGISLAELFFAMV